MIFCGRATRGRGLPSLDARSEDRQPPSLKKVRTSLERPFQVARTTPRPAGGYPRRLSVKREHR
jgi:hypothetical protein